MKVNVKKFEELIKKATWNYSIPSCWLHFTKDNIYTKMISDDNNAVLELNLNNDVIIDGDEMDFYFSNPAKNVKPYIDLFTSEEIDLKPREDQIELIDQDHISRLHFCSPSAVRSFSGQNPSDEIFFFNENLDQIFPYFQKLKGVAVRFKKIYMSTFNGKLYLEATDKESPSSNSVKFHIGKTDKNIDIMFDFRYINSLMKMISYPEDFNFKFAFLEEEEAGIFLFEKEDKSELYYLTSKSE